MDLYGLAGGLLTQVVQQFAGMSVGLPAKRFVAPGPMPAWDGEQVTVHLIRTFSGSPAGESPYMGPGYSEHAAEFGVVIIRNTPTIDDYNSLPTPEAMMASAQQNMADVATLQRAIETIKNKGLWVDHATPFSVGSATSEGPEGGLVAAAITCSVGVYT